MYKKSIMTVLFLMCICLMTACDILDDLKLPGEQPTLTIGKVNAISPDGIATCLADGLIVFARVHGGTYQVNDYVWLNRDEWGIFIVDKAWDTTLAGTTGTTSTTLE